MWESHCLEQKEIARARLVRKVLWLRWAALKGVPGAKWRRYRAPTSRPTGLPGTGPLGSPARGLREGVGKWAAVPGHRCSVGMAYVQAGKLQSQRPVRPSEPQCLCQ